MKIARIVQYQQFTRTSTGYLEKHKINNLSMKGYRRTMPTSIITNFAGV